MTADWLQNLFIGYRRENLGPLALIALLSLKKGKSLDEQTFQMSESTQTHTQENSKYSNRLKDPHWPQWLDELLKGTYEWLRSFYTGNYTKLRPNPGFPSNLAFLSNPTCVNDVCDILGITQSSKGFCHHLPWNFRCLNVMLLWLRSLIPLARP